MKRRKFLALLGVAAIGGSRTAAAQGRIFRIGFLALGNPDPAPFVKGVRDGLRDLGYIEGQNVSFEPRSAEGKADRLASLAAELVTLKVDRIAGICDDRNFVRGSLGGRSSRRLKGNDQVHLERDKLRRERGKPVGFAFGRARFE